MLFYLKIYDFDIIFITIWNFGYKFSIQITPSLKNVYGQKYWGGCGGEVTATIDYEGGESYGESMLSDRVREKGYAIRGWIFVQTLNKMIKLGSCKSGSN